MYDSIQKFDYHLNKTNPCHSFPHQQRQLVFPNSSTYKSDKNMKYHFESKTQKIYSPFQINYYVPPHLNSSKVHGLIHKGQCKAWKIKHITQPTTGQKQNTKYQQIRQQHVHNMTTNYDTQYRRYEDRIKTIPGKDYHVIEPRIKYLIDQDRPKKPTKLKYASEESQQDQNQIA